MQPRDKKKGVWRQNSQQMDSDLTTLVEALTPTLGLAKELSVVGTGLASGLAVLELVRVLLSTRVLAV